MDHRRVASGEFSQTPRNALPRGPRGLSVLRAGLFTLYDTFGFPVELSTEEAYKQGIKLSDDWRAEFDARMAEQRQRSKTARKGQFSGGLEGHDPIHLKYHSGVPDGNILAFHNALEY